MQSAPATGVERRRSSRGPQSIGTPDPVRPVPGARSAVDVHGRRLGSPGATVVDPASGQGWQEIVLDGGRTTLVPADGARSGEHRLWVPLPAARVHSAPPATAERFAADLGLRDALGRHYGLLE